MRSFIQQHLRGLSYAVWALTIVSAVALLITRSLPALIAFVILMSCRLFLLRQQREERE